MSHTSQPLGVESFVQRRIPTTRTTLALLVGDLVALFGFVAVGQYKHGYLFWEHPARTVLVLSPIVCSWLIVGPLFGLVTDSTLANYRHTAVRLVPAWVLVAVITGLIRRTRLVPGYAPPSFFAVSIVFGLLFLAGWRVLARYLLA